jgi:hypothetical protein
MVHRLLPGTVAKNVPVSGQNRIVVKILQSLYHKLLQAAAMNKCSFTSRI